MPPLCPVLNSFAGQPPSQSGMARFFFFARQQHTKNLAIVHYVKTIKALEASITQNAATQRDREREAKPVGTT